MAEVKLLALTDLHMSNIKPAGRIGTFVEDVDIKLNEVISIVKEEKINAVICGGDVFHSAAPAFSTIIRFITFVECLDIPFITIAGTHDLIGTNLDALYRTALGFLERISKIVLLSEGTRTVTKVGDVVIGVRPASVTGIELVHECVLPMPTFGDYTLISEYNTSAKLVMVGHYHSGFEDVNSNGTLYIGPGSFVRMSAHTSELTRRPRIGIITVENDNYSIRWRELTTAKNGMDVLEQPIIAPKIDFANLVKTWVETTPDIVDAYTLMDIIATEDNVNKDVIDYTTKLLEEVKNPDESKSSRSK